MRLLRLLECARRVIECLFRHLVRTQVVFAAVMRGGNPVSMSGFFVHFSGNSMYVPWHRRLPDQLTRPAVVAAIITKQATGGRQAWKSRVIKITRSSCRCSMVFC